MRKNYPTPLETVSTKQLRHSFLPVTVLFAALLLATVLPVKLFAAAPTITSFTPASGPVGTLVTINGTNLSTPTAFTIGGKSAIAISNTGSVLVGMVMTGAATGLVSITTAGGTASGSGNFTVTATPYPSAQQGSALVGTGAAGAAQQGFSAALSADGNTAIVGGYQDNSGAGAAWIYTRTGGTWVQQGSKLVGTGNTGVAAQGWSVSLSADGNTAILGGYQDNSHEGAAWVFTRSSGAWAQQGKLVGTGGVGPSQQGSAVSLSADGNTAMVGGNNDDSGTGAAWFYTRSGGTWTQQGSKMVGTGSVGPPVYQGSSVALSADGNTAIAGGYADNTIKAGTGVTQGAAWVYTRSGGAWTQQGNKLVGTDSDPGSEQGWSVALSADGNTAIVGGPDDNGNAGAAWVYTRANGGWAQQGSKLVGTGIVGGVADQGISVSLSADGNTAIVGGAVDNTNQGAAWIYTRSGSTWAQQGNKLVGTGNTGAALQGQSVSLSADGNLAIVGGPADNSNVGAAWVYTGPQPPPTIAFFSPASGPPGTLVTINGTGLTAPTALTIGGQSAIVLSYTGSTLVAMVMPGAITGTVSITTSLGTSGSSGIFTPTATPYPSVQQGSKLAGAGNIGAAQQGHAIAISADGNTAIVGGYADNSSQGAAWIYTRSGTTWAQQGSKLVGTGNVGAAQQGWSVAISADGNTAIVGGYQDNLSVGAAWVYTRSGSTWTQQGTKLVATDGAGTSEQGISVSLSADGNTAIVGGSQDNAGIGAAWVYIRSGGIWSQDGSKLVGSGGMGTPGQGIAVVLSADGNTAIVGGDLDNSFQGAAWVYTRSGATWTQQGLKLVGTGNTGTAEQGNSVSLNADGNTAVVGGSSDNSGVGAAWVYSRSAGTWAQQGTKLVGTGSVGAASQGSSVSLSADGNTAIIGGSGDNSNQGSAWVYTRSSGAWVQKGSKLVGTGNTGAAAQGYSIAMSEDGTTAITGGPFDNSSQGAAWVYLEGHPTITSFSPVTGPPGTLVTVSGTNLGALTTFTIGGQSAIVLSNTASTVVALVMPGALTGTVSITTGGGTASSTTNFTVTATKYPSVQQGTKLVGTGGIGNPEQGYSISLSADGNTAIVGGVSDNSSVGAAWVYTRSGTTWTQQGSKLVGTGSVGSPVYQGTAVSLSADGNTAIVGAYQDNAGVGAAWVYTRSGSTWTQQGSKLVGSDYLGDAQQGISVSLSADGNTAMVGGYNDNSGLGAAWVYTRSSGTWAQQGSKLVGTGNIGAADQGTSVSLSADGNTAIVGAYNDNSGVGATWVFTRIGTTWTQQGPKLVGTGSIGAADQGRSVSLSADGNTAIVGGFADNANVGAVWVYTRSGGAWVQQGPKLVGTGSTGAAHQGISISLSADGNTAMVGGYTDNTDQGAVWVYTRSGGAWAQKGTKLLGTGNTGMAFQGVSVSLSADGNTAIAGGYGDNSFQGAAWVFIPGVSNNALLSTIKLTPASALTNTGTSGTTTTYTTTAAGSTTSVTVTPTAQDPSATIKVNGVAVTSGTASGSIALAAGTTTTITTIVTAQNGTTTHTYSIVVTKLSNDAQLSTIKLTPASTLTNTGTVGSTTTYTTTAAGATTSVTVTPTVHEAHATVKVNGVAVVSGAASGSIALAAGATTNINIVVTAQDGSTTHTYSIAVTRLSNNVSLSSIKLTPVSTLTNTGTVGSTTTYTTSVSNATASVTLTPTTVDTHATIKVNGTAVTSGTASGSIALAVGQTVITTVVTAQDGVTTHTYSITVTRAKSNNALLSAIKLTPTSTLTNTGTTGTTTTYTTSVSNGTTSVTVTATTQDATATMRVNGTAVTSGTASGSIALAVGNNTITTVVTAQDGTTTHTYSITVTRATGPLMSLYLPVSVVQPTDNINIENDGVMVHQGVSPNGDGINDFLIIDGITAYPDNELTIIDLSGTLVFEAKGYNNISKVFEGHSSRNERMLQPGTYFYALDYVAVGQSRRKTGYIILRY